MEKINPAVIFALLAVIFAILNILLWLMVWNKTTKPPVDDKDNPEIDTAVREIKNKIDEGVERNLRLEDQLWGILDKLKELDRDFKQFKSDFLSIGQMEDDVKIKDIDAGGNAEEADSINIEPDDPESGNGRLNNSPEEPRE